ncbi:MAG: ATP-binding cassette domain-containing protein [Bacteroides sp.]|nr:ATP-binding cassette domain-containing protein [Roseburia sp.]MCM1346843.1 ATP-binding cassette domain-containing protein [Bacteroides sp.]MCM1420631.1 ATP-binding cassette domain-containing protein [Bacteroides sp.]
MLEIKEISYGYRHGFNVFDNFSLNIKEGGVYGLLGKNGTGKSTLLYLIMGLLRPQKGCVHYNGTDTTLRTPDIQQDMFIVPEEYNLPSISLSKYIKVMKPFYPRFSDKLLEECLTGFDMNTDLNLGALSMGQKKKIYMCMALATNTRLLVMDEPTNGLDIPSKSQFRKVVAKGMTDDKTVIISTHQVRDVELLLDHLAIIDRNRVLLNASMPAIGKRLQFIDTDRNSIPSNAIYTEQVLGGYSCIVPNSGENETPVNLELLFNALLTEGDAIRKQVNEE